MPKRAERFALMLSAVSFAFVAAMAATSSGAAQADNVCIEQSPTQPAPEGKRWYVRYDQAKGRKCWFLGNAAANGREAAAPQAQPGAEPTLSSKLSSLFGNVRGPSANAAQPSNPPQNESANAPRRPPGNRANANRSGVRAEQKNIGESHPEKRAPATTQAERAPAMTKAERNALFEQFLQWHEGEQSISTLDSVPSSQ